MQYFVTLYIEHLKGRLGLPPFSIPHAFLFVSHTNPDKLDNLDKEKQKEALANKDWGNVDFKWYQQIYPSILSDEFNGEGFFGFAPVESTTNHWGKVYENNQ